MMEVIWQGDSDWGDVECFRDFIDGKYYRRATKREEPTLVVPTKYGDVRLRLMTRREVASIKGKTASIKKGRTAA